MAVRTPILCLLRTQEVLKVGIAPSDSEIWCVKMHLYKSAIAESQADTPARAREVKVYKHRGMEWEGDLSRKTQQNYHFQKEMKNPQSFCLPDQILQIYTGEQLQNSRLCQWSQSHFIPIASLPPLEDTYISIIWDPAASYNIWRAITKPDSADWETSGQSRCKPC